ncbi:dienelactone hydrolase [Bradyrhizobium sp. AZCC 2262]|uniref:alpha/beta hydrolase family protein n=1 Tax=Bradyrhizobium sp. AZCC 2262 TaxID=3117022 RepID=UPI002FF1A42A
MRILELSIVAALLGYIVNLLSPYRGEYLWFGFVPLLCLLAVALHLVVEGYRWQMLPIYSVLCACLLYETVPSLITDVQAQYFAGLVALCCLGAGIVLSTAFPVFQLPPPTGPHAVGTQIRHLVDDKRRYSADPNSPRELMVQIWYPAAASARGRVAPYRESVTTTLQDARFSLVKTHSIIDAPLAGFQTRYPLLLYAPSWNGMRTENTLLAEEFASHGYIVAAIDHPYSSLATAFPDGRVVRTKLLDEDFYSSETTFSGFLKTAEMQIRIRTDDVRLVLDTFEDFERADPEGLLTHHLDLDHTGIFGFSLGGGVAAQASWLDRRLKACVNMDGLMAGESLERGTIAPLFFMSEAAPPSPSSIPDANPSTRRELVLDWEQFVQMRKLFTTYGGYWLTIPTAKHFNFSDYAFSSPLRIFNLSGPIVPANAARSISRYALAFFDQHLKRIDQSLLTEKSHAPDLGFERSTGLTPSPIR